MSNSSVTPAAPTCVRVGLACVVTDPCGGAERAGRVLVGRRRKAHGYNRFAFPGGHLEVGEEFADCAIRETFEETNLTVGNARYLTVTNDIAMGGDPTKHYVTVYVHTTILPGSGELLNTEPEKCFGWEWMPWSELQRLSSEEPERLFESVAKFAAMYDKFDL